MGNPFLQSSAKQFEYTDRKESFIVEVEGDPKQLQEYIELYLPFVDVIAIYEKLFNGLAFKAHPEKLSRLSSVDLIKAIYPAQTYETVTPSISHGTDLDNLVIPAALNTTKYTGKGVKVAVIDTGIDYLHKDLQQNYVGGYDLIDLDDDPTETTESEGIPTSHGTHVAGIIAAKGSLNGVAPDSEIYAYRALGPGGRGTSVHVIAAMEQAMNDGVDIMNLSLGNSVNGADYPTSMAVNRAIELGTAVVIANGNDGPNHWTVGSPATASKALSVGASSNPELLPFLYEPIADQEIQITLMHGSVPWNFKTDYLLVNMDEAKESENFHGKIAITARSDQTFYEKAIYAQEQGVIALLIYNNEEGTFQGTVENKNNPVDIPVATITKKDGEWLNRQANKESLYIHTNYQQIDKSIAPFSSRGPVTINWDIKPEVLAPGTNIISTIPGGYEVLQGTSMAAPHVSGAIAVMKEARPNWTNDQIIGAIKTTAKQMKQENGRPFDPIEQGMGEIQLEKAIHTKTIIDNPLLAFGKINNYHETNRIEIAIENTTNEPLSYSFDIPKKEKGLSWNLPQRFEVPGKGKKIIPIELNITTQQLESGIHQGWLTLNQASEKYHLPYLFINHHADYPKTMGFEFSLKPFSKEKYSYKIYTVEENIKKVVINLYDQDTLVFDRKLIELNDLKTGINEGEIDARDVGEPGLYYALVIMELENGTYDSYEIELLIEDVQKVR